MDLEVREIPIQSRGMYNSRLKSYKQEMEKLEKDFVSIKNIFKQTKKKSCFLREYFQWPCSSSHKHENVHVVWSLVLQL